MLHAEAWIAGIVVMRLLWQGAILGLASAAAMAMLRTHTPALRYGAGCVALVLFAVLIPANLVFAPEPPPPPLPAVPAYVPSHLNARADASIRPREDAAALPLAVPDRLAARSDAVVPQRDERPRVSAPIWYDAALPWIGGAWWAGSCLVALYEVLGLLAVSRLRRSGNAAPASLLARADSIRRRLGLRAAVPIRVVEGLTTAMVTGFYNVVILVPASMLSGMSPEAVEAILAHEFAHLRRWDRWINLFQCILEVLLFFHPAYWWLSRRLRVERELCCDELALRICPDRSSYVRALLSLSECAGRGPSLALSSHGGSLSHRVRHILGLAGNRADTKRDAGSVGAVLIAVAAMLLLFVSRTGGAGLKTGAELPFSDLRSIGMVQARWEDDVLTKGAPWLTEYTDGWTVLEEARGVVFVPQGAQVKLSIAKTDLSGLAKLPPDAVYFLDARYRDLTDNDLAPIAHLTGLRALDLSENRLNLHGPGLATLSPLKNLEWLNLYFTQIDTLPENAIRQFPRLRFLSGHFKQNSGQVLVETADLDQLEFLSLRSGAPVTAEQVGQLSGKESLHGLVLYNMALSDETLSALRDLPQLRYLGLGVNAVGDASMARIAALKELRHLDLHKTAITDAGVAELASLPRLETLNLAYTSVTEACLESLASMPALYSVNFMDTKVSESRAARFAGTIAARGLSHAPLQRSSNPRAPRVGVVMSHFTSTGPVRPGFEYGEHYSYSLQDSAGIAAALNEANFDVYAVVEPGTENLGELPGILRDQGLATKVIDGTSDEALMALDGIIMCAVYNAQPAMLEAIARAVEAGVGLVSVGALGDDLPGNVDPKVTYLTGLDGVDYVNHGCQDSTVQVVTPHPVLGAATPGSSYNVRMLLGTSGSEGVSDGSILLNAPPSFPPGFPALYVRELGEGRIFRAQWHHPMQPGLPYSGYTLYLRALNWVARRDAATVW